MRDGRSFDGLGRLLARLAPYHPQAAYAMADALGALRNRLTRRWPSAAEVQTLFPHLGRDGAARAAARIGALNERNRVLVHCILRHGSEPLRGLVSADESFRSIRGPLILGTFHVGAVHALGPALERIESPVLAFRQGVLFTARGALEIQSTEGAEQRRAAGLHRALRHLRRGGVVVLALDAAADGTIETQCLSHRLDLAPGAFALSRWTGAPIRPVVARWDGHQVRVRTGERLGTPEDAALWLERYLLSLPSELTLGLLRALLGVS